LDGKDAFDKKAASIWAPFADVSLSGDLKRDTNSWSIVDERRECMYSSVYPFQPLSLLGLKEGIRCLARTGHPHYDLISGRIPRVATLHVVYYLVSFTTEKKK
jgi:hypothetical protein